MIRLCLVGTKKVDAELRFGDKRVPLTNLDKIFYPKTGFTKGDVIEFYQQIAPVVLPHLRGRPLTLKRYPNGVEGSFFYEKRCPPHRPEWVRTVPVRRRRDDKEIDFCVVENQATLLWVANLAALELHTSLAKGKDLFRPTFVVFDLDPGPSTDVLDCAHVARWLKRILRGLDLESWCKTSGSKGIQLYVPLNTKVTYEATGEFAHALARKIEEDHPDEVVTTMKKEERKGKVFIDWSQNAPHKTTANVYSLRAKDRPTVSTPVTWKELERAIKRDDPDLLTFESDEVLRRVEAEGDLFEPVLVTKQGLPRSIG